jgi:hypothetical protein
MDVAPKKKMGRPKKVGPKPQAVVTVRCLDPWKIWLDRFAKAEGAELSVLIEKALFEHAKRRKFETPPVRIS